MKYFNEKFVTDELYKTNEKQFFVGNTVRDS